MTMVGEKIVLKAVEPEDLGLMYIIENDSSLWKYGHCNVPYSLYSLRRFIEENRSDVFADGQVRFAIHLKEGGVVGFVDLQNFSAVHMRAEVGIVIMEDAQGCGYATDALGVLATYAREILHMHHLYAVVSTDNGKACKLFHRSGYTCAATLPQWLRKGDGFADASLFSLLL